nr:hypothetical protein [uncultured archaeon]
MLKYWYQIVPIKPMEAKLYQVEVERIVAWWEERTKLSPSEALEPRNWPDLQELRSEIERSIRSGKLPSKVAADDLWPRLQRLFPLALDGPFPISVEG